jgi:3-methyladenine DNA glycosylase AlkD
MAVATARATSATTVASQRFVAAHLPQAAELGASLAELVGDPDAFVTALRAGFGELGDPVVVAGQRMIAPRIGPVLGVRLPLMTAVHREFKRGNSRTSSSLILDVADRLLREDSREIRWFGMWSLGRLLPSDPERTWQLLRRAAGEADDWISVDTLAHPYAEGILRDGRRWAEIEQFVYSSWRWERRLVGSTLATLPHVHGLPGDPAEQSAAIVAHGLPAIGQLIGDDEPDVQKALSWALRTLAGLDRAAVSRFLETETATAIRTGDGQRAWVIRDSLSKLAPDVASRLRASLDGIRRRPGAPSTSLAAAAAAQLLQQLPIGTPSRAGDELRRTSAK